MHRLEHRILLIFKKEPNKEFSTTEIVKSVFSKEYEEIRYQLLSTQSDNETKRTAQRKKAELHRRILYHLNKLVNDEILAVSRMKERGEKLFQLGFESGDYVIERRKRKVMISKPKVPSVPIETYEEEGIAKRFDKHTWISRMNSIIIQGDKFNDLTSLYTLLTKVFSYVNDCAGINQFEILLQKQNFEDITNFINKVNIDTQDFNKEVSLVIDFANVNDSIRLTEFLYFYCHLNPQKIHLILKTDPKGMQKHRKTFETAIKLYSTAKRKINIHNNMVHHAPYLVGRAGVYTFEDPEWESFRKQRPDVLFCVCGQISVIIDVHRFFKQYNSAHDFRTLVMKCAKTLMIANRIQRLNSNNYFLDLNKAAEPRPEDLYLLGKNYIRLWNYNLEDPRQKELFELLQSCKRNVDIFCRTEETIYKSCGIPIRFRIVLSSGFSKHQNQGLSQRRYLKRTIRSIKDFDDEEISRGLEERESLLSTFSKADRVRFFRAGEVKAPRIVSEFMMLMNTFELPFFCYDFAERKGELTLDQFFP
ncbi:MAG: hypothetical protein KKG59_03865 [Nanoarchaeota archaeon]|nr:hypothetical protein [Nanoarchaeota archaeon]